MGRILFAAVFGMREIGRLQLFILVCTMFMSRSVHSTVARDHHTDSYHPFQIVQFRPNVHIPSPHRIDEDYDLMGDILEVCFVFLSETVTYFSEKLRPLPQNIDVESASSFPARICTSGRVISVQTDIHTFTMIVRQVVVGTESCVRLRIRGLLGREPFWPRATPFLPAPHSLVAFTGNLVAFRGGVAVVALDDMTFLPFDFSYDEYGFADVESDLL